jgi:hypothetical protein
VADVGPSHADAIVVVARAGANPQLIIAILIELKLVNIGAVGKRSAIGYHGRWGSRDSPCGENELLTDNRDLSPN